MLFIKKPHSTHDSLLEPMMQYFNVRLAQLLFFAKIATQIRQCNPGHRCLFFQVKENNNLDAVNLEMILYLTKNSVENTFFSIPFSFLLFYERKFCWMILLSEVALLVRQKLLDKKKTLERQKRSWLKGIVLSSETLVNEVFDHLVKLEGKKFKPLLCL